MKPYRLIVLSFIIGAVVYVVLILAWNYSSHDFKPNNLFVDTTIHSEDLSQLWTKYRKGHTHKDWQHN